jgi:hypothetical protein
MTTTENTPSPVSAAALQRLADAELSMGARLGHVTLLLVALRCRASSPRSGSPSRRCRGAHSSPSG